MYIEIYTNVWCVLLFEGVILSFCLLATWSSKLAATSNCGLSFCLLLGDEGVDASIPVVGVVAGRSFHDGRDQGPQPGDAAMTSRGTPNSPK